MSNLKAVGSLVVAFLGTASAAVAATEDTEGKIVQAIRWQGLQTLPQETA